MAVDLLECSRFRKIAIAELDRFFQSPIHYDGHYKGVLGQIKSLDEGAAARLRRELR